MEILNAYILLVGCVLLSFVPILFSQGLFNSILMENGGIVKDKELINDKKTYYFLKLWALDLVYFGGFVVALSIIVTDIHLSNQITLVLSAILFHGALKWGFVLMFWSQSVGLGRLCLYLPLVSLALSITGVSLCHDYLKSVVK